MYYRKRYEKTDEEIAKLISKKWTPAKSFAELRERASVSLYGLVGIKKIDANKIWGLFKKCPEYFFFDDNIKEIKDEYRSWSTFEFNRANTQIENMENTLESIQRTVKTLYKNAFAQFVDFPFDEVPLYAYLKTNRISMKPSSQTKNNQTFIWEPGVTYKKAETDLAQNKSENVEKKNLEKVEETLKDQKQKRLNKNRFVQYRFTDFIVKKFLNDNTSITNFVDKEDRKIAYFFDYHNIKTVGNFMTYISDKHQRTNLSVYVCNKSRVEYERFVNNIFAHIINTSALTGGDDEFFETLKKTSAEKFIKDSDEMKKIARDMTSYIVNLTYPYVKAGVSQSDIDKLMDAEYQKYHKIVDDKRKIVEANSHKGVRERINERTKKEEKYKVDTKFYDMNKGERYKF